MLKDLDSIEWEKLQHAYGSATDVPSQIRALASEDNDIREDALNVLYSNIYHQGSIYQATGYAVPFLIELLTHENVPQKGDLLMLLAHIRHGGSWHEAHGSLDLHPILRERIVTPDFDDKVREELRWVDRAHQAVDQGYPVYVGFLSDPVPEVRADAIYLLAAIYSRANDTVLHLRSLIEQETTPLVRTHGIMAWVLISSSRDDTLSTKLMEMYRSENDALTKVVMAMLLVQLGSKSEEVVYRLIEVMQEPGDLMEIYRGFAWNNMGLQADCARILGIVGSDFAEQIVPALAKVVEEGAFIFVMHTMVSVMLSIVFGKKPAPKRLLAKRLTHLQQIAISAIAESKYDWSHDGNMSNILRQFNLPTSRSALGKLLK